MKNSMIYLPTNICVRSDTGIQNSDTKMSAIAKFTMKKLVTVCIHLYRKTTAITMTLPKSANKNAIPYAIIYIAVISGG